eukprot:14806805-Alexandrium_andersonii.AAC.1
MLGRACALMRAHALHAARVDVMAPMEVAAVILSSCPLQLSAARTLIQGVHAFAGCGPPAS